MRLPVGGWMGGWFGQLIVAVTLGEISVDTAKQIIASAVALQIVAATDAVQMVHLIEAAGNAWAHSAASPTTTSSFVDSYFTTSELSP